MKKNLRRELIRIRDNLSKLQVMEKNNLIKKKKLFEMDIFKEAYTILFYVSYGKEVNTHNMIKESILNGKKIFVPIVDKRNKKLLITELKNWKDLTPGSYNILEPKRKNKNSVSLESIDLIIVPGIGFDRNGNRIGHGCGYYDRLLRDSSVSIIGFVFQTQLLDKISVEKHDIQVDVIITEDEIIKCFI